MYVYNCLAFDTYVCLYVDIFVVMLSTQNYRKCQLLQHYCNLGVYNLLCFKRPIYRLAASLQYLESLYFFRRLLTTLVPPHAYLSTAPSLGNLFVRTGCQTQTNNHQVVSLCLTIGGQRTVLLPLTSWLNPVPGADGIPSRLMEQVLVCWHLLMSYQP